MILDFRKAASPKQFRADVCVIGAGAAGMSLALSLARAGLSILLVESGGLKPGAEDKLNGGQLADGVRFKGLEEGRTRSLGGGTKLWYGQCIRLDEVDYVKRHWVPFSGWPISPQELSPFYSQAEEFFSIAGQPYGGTIYQRFGMSEPPFDPDAIYTHFAIYSPNVDLGTIYRRKLEDHASINVLLGATATAILTTEQAARVAGVRLKALTGAEGEVMARAVVLCGGGIENARLLLLSDDIKSNGLGNDFDLVGRFFQDHPNGQTATITTESPKKILDLFSLLYAAPLRFFPKVALSPAVQEREQTLNCNGHFVFEYGHKSGIEAGKALYRSMRRREFSPELLNSLFAIATDLPATLAAAKQFFIDHKSPDAVPDRIRFQCYLEQQPDPENRVLVTSTLDSLGQREAQIRWKLGGLERHTLQVMTATVGMELSRLGLGQTVPDSWLTETETDWQENLGDAFHHIGTTRMAVSATEGVVDTNCEVFGTGGLYVAGSSVFPTSGYANPTLTIVALAIRLAEHLASALC